MTTKKSIITKYSSAFHYCEKILNEYNGNAASFNNLLAIAILDIAFDGNIEVTLTKGSDFKNDYDFSIGVGGSFDTSKGKYDYHVANELIMRDYEIEYIPIKYMAAGAVWRDYGLGCLIKLNVPEKSQSVIHRNIDEEIIGNLDFITYKQLSRDCSEYKESDIDDFNEQLAYAKDYLVKQIVSRSGYIKEKQVLDDLISKNTLKYILVMDKANIPSFFVDFRPYLREKGIYHLVINDEYSEYDPELKQWGSIEAWHVLNLDEPDFIYSSTLKDYSMEQLDELIGVKGSLSLSYHRTLEGAIKLAELRDTYTDLVPDAHLRPLRELPLDIIKILPDAIREETLAQYYEDHPESTPAKAVTKSKKGKTSFWSSVVDYFWN